MGLGVIKEWRCLEHGEFEASHAICPAMGCDSRVVFREFRTAPSVGTDFVRRHSASSKRTSDMYRISDFRTAREGETAHGGQAGKGLLWGDDCRKVLGKSFGELMGSTGHVSSNGRWQAKPLGDLTRNNGMADTAEQAGVTARRVAKPGELTGTKVDRTPTGATVTEKVARAQMGVD